MILLHPLWWFGITLNTGRSPCEYNFHYSSCVNHNWRGYLPGYSNSWNWKWGSPHRGHQWHWSRTMFCNCLPQSKGQHLKRSIGHTITVFSVNDYRYCIRPSCCALRHFRHIPRAECAWECYLVVKNYCSLLRMNVYLIVPGHLWYLKNPLRWLLLLFWTDRRLSEILKTHAIAFLALLRLYEGDKHKKYLE